MYVSRLMLDPQWFARQNRYQLHQALWRAFPDRAAGDAGKRPREDGAAPLVKPLYERTPEGYKRVN